MGLTLDLNEAAIDYLRRGLKIIALQGKLPHGKIHPNGINSPIYGAPESDIDYTAIAAAFSTEGVTGIGIATGEHYFVIDIDGEDGARQWQSLVGDDYIPVRWVARTGRGLHLWFSSFNPRVKSRKLGPKLDLKGIGGYVAAPPSRHPDGGEYEWLIGPEDGPPFEPPPALEAHLEKLAAADARSAELRVQHSPVRHVPIENVDGHWRFYPSWGFDGVIQRMRDGEEGNRNNLLFWAARTMVEQWATPEEMADLTKAALESGLDPVEISRTIRAARRATDG